MRSALFDARIKDLSNMAGVLAAVVEAKLARECKAILVGSYTNSRTSALLSVDRSAYASDHSLKPSFGGDL
jgi:hypothetical protein